ncbi:MAG: VOC family protein [Planctomycetaceae bacterium]|nr:VOC family protein [Planctomycetaceae bacterium]
MSMRFSESPDATPPGMLQAGFENKIMHSSFVVDGQRIMASDGCNDQSGFDGFRLALSVDTEAQALRFFNALAEGGNVEMPLTPTFWSPCYGMVTDRFQVAWMVMVPGQVQCPEGEDA